jgi:hypothetical protein
MEPTDWVLSGVIFLGLIGLLFALLPTLMPQKPDVVTETEIKETLDSVTKDIYVKALILKSDCNSELYDCNRFFPVVLDANTDLNYILSKPFEAYLDKLYTVLLPQELASVFQLEPGTLEPRYLVNLDLSGSTNDGVINVQNSYLDVNITDTNATIHFYDTNEDITISYPTMPMSLLKNTQKLIVVGNDTNNFHLIFFPRTSEFWLDVPDDIQVSITSSAINWRVGSSTGVLSSDAWWDYSSDDDEWWHYRLPITVNTLECERTNEIVQETIDFGAIKEKLSVTATIDSNSFRLVEYSNGQPIDYNPDTNEIDPIPFKMEFNTETEIGVLTWQLTGTTDANTTRVYYLYFDFLPYQKSSPSYSDLTYTPLSCPVLITEGDAQDTSVTQYALISGEAYLFNPNTIYISVLNDVDRSWLSAVINYRIPLAFDAGKYNREDVNVSLDINFAQEFASVNCSGCDLNIDGVYLVEVSDLDTATVIDTLTKGTDWDLSYNETTKIGELWFIVKGTTTAGTTRYYYLYYDNS